MNIASQSSQPMDPRIGVLNSGRFYAFVDGPYKPEFMGTREEVEIALGIRTPPSKESVGVQKARRLRSFIVTVTPNQVSYAGTWSDQPYEVTVDAWTHSDAITRVRQARNEVEGRFGVRATYRARVAPRA